MFTVCCPVVPYSLLVWPLISNCHQRQKALGSDVGRHNAGSVRVPCRKTGLLASDPRLLEPPIGMVWAVRMSLLASDRLTIVNS